ncbi:hypothetical protein BDV25DRAFT_135787 [Aspergillus avenaceus]|uniref:Serine protein kinase n=1 Tax=Aspergillus avenaceus TaxID=36643 RepID=A0A5N6U884_ASPAV|nr:hypothetical protein BDV25DRAFT_135787 [Aspergillus avenaceus]
MSRSGTTPATDDYAYISKNETVVILDTSDVPYKLDKSFSFEGNNCLLYAERILISGTVDLRGKESFGLFCTELEIDPSGGTIDISGEDGHDQITVTKGSGSPGTDGKAAGNVWAFVQNLPRGSLGNLTIVANGGTGGNGGSTTDWEGLGGDGGNGGKSGDVTFLYGSLPMQVYLDFPIIRKQLWPERASDFANGHSCSALPDYVPDTMKGILSQYMELARELKALVSVLHNRLLVSPTTNKTRAVLAEILQSSDAPASVNTSSLSKIIDSRQRIQEVVRSDNHPDIDTILNGISKVLEDLNPVPESDLTDVLVSVFEAAWGDRGEIWNQVKGTCRSQPGAGGLGGSSGDPNGPQGQHGHVGANTGSIVVQNLCLNGDTQDLNATQVFAFPDQCQMVLNKANEQFFTNTVDSRKSASDMYNTIISRLAFLDNFEDNTSKPLALAYDRLENEWNLTISGITQLRSIYREARSRFNRLVLGQDMFGHMANWVPRLSFLYYRKSVTDQLSFLGRQEDLTNQYEDALKKGEETQKYIVASIRDMKSSKDAAEDQIALLTGVNGPLSTTAYKIDTFTPELKRKREDIKEKVSHIHFKFQFDPKMIIDAFTTLITSKLDLSSLAKFIQYGYGDYESSTKEKGVSGLVNKDYIMDQFNTCADTLESLVGALDTNKDNTIQLDDPRALKLITSVEAMKKLLHNFKDAIPEDEREGISDALDDYVDTVLTRNNAVLEYNSSIQLLLDSLQTRDYCEEQLAKLSQPGIKIDPTLPFVVFWMRRMRDSLRLRLMQYLNYESRAIRYWGLLDEVPFSDPGPLQGYAALGYQQTQLEGLFNNALEFYTRSVRDIWPADPSALGLVYKLTDEQKNLLQTQSTTGDYTTFVTVDPDRTANIFRDWVDIRLEEVRVWLFGVKLPDSDPAGRKLLSFHITHPGDESIIDTLDQKREFSHDPLNVQFVYDASKVNSIKDIPGDAVFTRADLEHDFGIGGIPKESSRAPLGPFTTWRLRVSQKANPGIDMSGLEEAYIEFRGSNRSLDLYKRF